MKVGTSLLSEMKYRVFSLERANGPEVKVLRRPQIATRVPLLKAGSTRSSTSPWSLCDRGFNRCTNRGVELTLFAASGFCTFPLYRFPLLPHHSTCYHWTEVPFRLEEHGVCGKQRRRNLIFSWTPLPEVPLHVYTRTRVNSRRTISVRHCSNTREPEPGRRSRVSLRSTFVAEEDQLGRSEVNQTQLKGKPLEHVRRT